MSKIVTAVHILINKPKKFIVALGRNGFLNWLSDELYLKMIYYLMTERKLNLDNPVTYNEKLQWLKINYHKQEFTTYADKYAVREFYRQTIGGEYLIPLIGKYDNVNEIPWNELPTQFVLKCTHSSGTNIICRNKKELDLHQSKRLLKRWLNTNYYWHNREWPYKDIKPRVICEKYIVDESGTELKDYKVFCFSGEPKLIQVDYGRFKEHKRNIYDIHWNYLHASIGYPTDPTVIIAKPSRLDEMLLLSKKLARDYPHIRVDFYYTGQKIYIGEMTLYHGSGYKRIEPESLDIEMGGWIKLPEEIRQ